MLCTKMTFAAVIAVIEACMLHSDEELNIQINSCIKVCNDRCDMH